MYPQASLISVGGTRFTPPCARGAWRRGPHGTAPQKGGRTGAARAPRAQEWGAGFGSSTDCKTDANRLSSTNFCATAPRNTLADRSRGERSRFLCGGARPPRVTAEPSPPAPRPRASFAMSEDENRVRATGEVVAAMIEAVREGKVINLNAVKNAAARKHGLKRNLKLVELIQAVPDEHRGALLPQLRAKPVRTASGIAVVAVMSKPHRCPHIATTGNICVYCPGGPDSDFEYSTQSYTGYEPTSMRAIRARYDPYVQARGRVDQLRKLGHSVDKVEYILMGGTFMSLPTEYRDWFVAFYDALSGASSASVADAVRRRSRAARSAWG